MVCMFDGKFLRNETTDRGVGACGRTLQLDVEPFASREIPIKDLEISIDTVVFLDVIQNPAERFQRLSKQKLPRAIDLVFFRFRDQGFRLPIILWGRFL